MLLRPLHSLAAGCALGCLATIIRGSSKWCMSAGSGGILWLPRAKECNLVLTIAATKKPHTIVVSEAVHPGAVIVHSLDVLGFDYGPCVACLRGHGWRSTAVRDNCRLFTPVTRSHLVAPLVVKKFETRRITARGLAGMWTDGLQVHGPRAQVVIYRALLCAESRTIDLRHRLFARSGTGATLHLKLERQGPPINQADVHRITSRHFAWHRGVARLAFAAPGGLKLGINRRGTP